MLRWARNPTIPIRTITVMASMNAPPDQAFHLYRRGKELLESRLETADGPTAACRLIADVFRALWPGARLCYCRLKCEETLAARALDDNGHERPGWAVALEEEVVRWLAAASSAGSGTLPAPPQTGLSATVRVARIQFRDARLGAAGSVFPADFSPQQEATASATFEELCSYLGVRLYAEECHERQRAALQSREQQTPFCILADMVSPVSHELQNVFNNIVLQAALLMREVTDDVFSQVEVISRLVLEASHKLNRLDDYRHRIAVPRLPLDLNRVATAALAELPSIPGVSVGLDLAPSLPSVPGSENEVRRLLRLLVSNAGRVLHLHGG